MQTHNLVQLNANIITQLRANDGHIQHGPFTGVPLLILTSTGALTGRARETPLAYSRDDDGRYVVVASNGGLAADPAWLHNLRAASSVRVEVDGERFTAHTSILMDGADRDRLYARHARILDPLGVPRGLPSYAQYQRHTSRRIPVVLLERVTLHLEEPYE